jgi:hypothetical protein
MDYAGAELAKKRRIIEGDVGAFLPQAALT